MVGVLTQELELCKKKLDAKREAVQILLQQVFELLLWISEFEFCDNLTANASLILIVYCVNVVSL